MVEGFGVGDILWQISLTVFAWECIRYSLSQMRELSWGQEKLTLMDECPRCGERVPNLEYHLSVCRAHLRKAVLGNLDGVYRPGEMPLLKK